MKNGHFNIGPLLLHMFSIPPTLVFAYACVQAMSLVEMLRPSCVAIDSPTS